MRKMKLGEKKASLGGLAGERMSFPRETEITAVIAILVDAPIARESRTLKCAIPVAFRRLPSASSSAHVNRTGKDTGDGETGRLRRCRAHHRRCRGREIIRQSSAPPACVRLAGKTGETHLSGVGGCFSFTLYSPSQRLGEYFIYPNSGHRRGMGCLRHPASAFPEGAQ